MKQNRTAYYITDSLLTFTFTVKRKNGDYAFEDYHCILEDMDELLIKKGSSTEIVRVDVFKLYTPKRRALRRWDRRRRR